MVQEDNFLQFLDDLETQEELEVGGGGLICETLHQFGFRVFAPGESGDTAFFPAPPGSGNKDKQAEVKVLANAFASEHGIETKAVRMGYQLTLRRDGAINLKNSAYEPVTWNNDLYENAPMWTLYTDAPSVLKDIFVPAMRELRISHGDTVWARIGYKNDPYKESLGEEGKTDEDQDGNPRFPGVRYVTEVFSSQADAYESVEYSGGEALKSDVPEGYTPKGWAKRQVPEIEEALLDGETVATLADEDEFDVPPRFIEAVLDSLVKRGEIKSRKAKKLR